MSETPPTARGYDWASDPLAYLFLLLLTPVSTLIGVLTLQPTILALFNAFAVFPYLAFAVRHGRAGRGLLFVCLWAALLYATGLVIGMQWPQRAEEMLPQAVEARAARLAWIATGERPADSIMPSLREGATVALASLPTAGIGGLYVEALAINRAAIAHARLAQQSPQPVSAALVLWPVWDVARHVAQGFLIVLLAAPLLRLSLSPLVRRWRWLGAAILFWLAAIAAGEVLAPAWLALVRAVTGLGR